MRRSCARNLTQAGVPREVAKQVTGHVSDSMWERYNIVIVADKISDFTRKDRSSGFSAAPSRSRTDGSQRDAKIRDRKSTRLNSSHRTISYAVFCLKKKKKQKP